MAQYRRRVLRPPFVLILSGPPGAGKSTVGPLVAARYEPSVVIESDWFFTTIAHGFIPPWKPEANLQNRTIQRVAFGAAARFAAGGYGVVLEGVVGPWHLDLAHEELDGLDVPIAYVVLRPDLDSILSRAAGRAHEVPRVAGNPPLADQEVLRAMWHGFADLGPCEGHVVDTTGLGPGESAELVVARIADGSLTLP